MRASVCLRAKLARALLFRRRRRAKNERLCRRWDSGRIERGHSRNTHTPIYTPCGGDATIIIIITIIIIYYYRPREGSRYFDLWRALRSKLTRRCYISPNQTVISIFVYRPHPFFLWSRESGRAVTFRFIKTFFSYKIKSIFFFKYCIQFSRN